MEPSTTEIRVDRVAAWRASGEHAEAFSRRGGYAASTLRWWASKLKREMTAVATPATLQIARVVRTAAVTPPEPPARAIIIEVIDAGVRIAIEAGADPTTLAMVLEVVRGGRA